MPSVTMNDGTLSSVVRTPLTSPTTIPNTTMSSSTGRVRASSWPTRLPAMMTCAVMSDPWERSNSPAMITKYCPIATIAMGATRCRYRMNWPGSAKLGLSTATATSRITSSRKTAPRG